MIYCPIYQVEEESATREAVDLIGDQIDGGTVTPSRPPSGGARAPEELFINH